MEAGCQQPSLTITADAIQRLDLKALVQWMDQPLSELLNNAVKHHDREQGVITITADGEGPSTTVTVSPRGTTRAVVVLSSRRPA